MIGASSAGWSHRLREGCRWRALPDEYRPYTSAGCGSVCSPLSSNAPILSRSGCEAPYARCREAATREASPTAAIIASLGSCSKNAIARTASFLSPFTISIRVALMRQGKTLTLPRLTSSPTMPVPASMRKGCVAQEGKLICRCSSPSACRAYPVEPTAVRIAAGIDAATLAMVLRAAWTKSRRRRGLWVCRFAWTTQTRCPHTHSRDRSSKKQLDS